MDGWGIAGGLLVGNIADLQGLVRCKWPGAGLQQLPLGPSSPLLLSLLFACDSPSQIASCQLLPSSKQTANTVSNALQNHPLPITKAINDIHSIISKIASYARHAKSCSPGHDALLCRVDADADAR